LGCLPLTAGAKVFYHIRISWWIYIFYVLSGTFHFKIGSEEHALFRVTWVLFQEASCSETKAVRPASVAVLTGRESVIA
jgi:hypothetical protein